MNESTQAIKDDVGQLADEAGAMMTATADMAGKQIVEARKQLNVALERGKEICCQVRDQAVKGAKATDEAVHEHPYQAIGIGIGVGVLIGYLISRRGSRNGECS